jgi:hypothetical protein
MAVTSEQVTVGDVPTALNTATENGQTLHIENVSGDAFTADLGGSAVVAGEGYGLAQNEKLTVHLKAGDVLYAINRSLYDDVDINVIVT